MSILTIRASGRPPYVSAGPVQPPPPPATSPDGTHATTIVESSGVVWTLGAAVGSNFKTLRNGVWVGSGIAVLYLYFSNAVYVKTAAADWYLWDGTVFVLLGKADPSVPIIPDPTQNQPVNVAAASKSAVATASSTYSSSYPTSAAINGSRLGTNWGNGAGWNDATLNSFPDWLQVSFAQGALLGEIDIITLPDNFATAPAPTLSTLFTQYGIVDFRVQYASAGIWTDVPGGNVVGNNKVWRQFLFNPPLSAKDIRVYVTAALAGYSRIVEIEAWTALTGTPGPQPAVSITSPLSNSVNVEPTTFTISGNAANNAGTIDYVEVWRGQIKVGTDTSIVSGAYSVTDVALPAGTYTYTAKAFAGSAIGISDPLVVTVRVLNTNGESPNDTKVYIQPQAGTGDWQFPLYPDPVKDATGAAWTFGLADLINPQYHQFQILKDGVQVGLAGGQFDRRGWGSIIAYHNHQVYVWDIFPGPNGTWRVWDGTAWQFATFNVDPTLPLLLAAIEGGATYPRIQDAVDAAAENDVILIDPGVREGQQHAAVIKKSLTLKSSDPTIFRNPGQWYGFQPWEIDLPVGSYNQYVGSGDGGVIAIESVSHPGLMTVTLVNPILKGQQFQFGGFASLRSVQNNDWPKGLTDATPLHLKVIDGLISRSNNGYLGGQVPSAGSIIEFDGTRFDYNGDGAGVHHNAYVPEVGICRLTNVWSTHSNSDHIFKSRAGETPVTGGCFGSIDGIETGFDFASGGHITLTNVVFIKGANSDDKYRFFHLAREAYFANVSGAGWLQMSHDFPNRFICTNCLFIDLGEEWLVPYGYSGWNFDELGFFKWDGTNKWNAEHPEEQLPVPITVPWDEISINNCTFAAVQPENIQLMINTANSFGGTGNVLVPMSAVQPFLDRDRPSYRLVDGSAVPTSPNGTHATSIVDSSSEVWTLGAAVGSDFKTLRDGVWVGSFAAVLYLYFNNNVYAKTAAGNWYMWGGSTFTSAGTADPSEPVIPTTSPDGTHATSIVSGDGAVWTLGTAVGSNFKTLRNGAQASTGAGVLYLYFGGVVYVKTADGMWYRWTGAVFTQLTTTDPSTPVTPGPTPSANGTHATTIVDGAQITWTLGTASGSNFQTLRAGVWVDGGLGVLYLYWNASVYYKNFAGTWFRWTTVWTSIGTVDPSIPVLPNGSPDWRIAPGVTKDVFITLDLTDMWRFAGTNIAGHDIIDNQCGLAIDQARAIMYSFCGSGHKSTKQQNGVFSIDLKKNLLAGNGLTVPGNMEWITERDSETGPEFFDTNYHQPYSSTGRPMGRHNWKDTWALDDANGRPRVISAIAEACNYGSGWDNCTDCYHIDTGDFDLFGAGWPKPPAVTFGNFSQLTIGDRRDGFLYTYYNGGVIYRCDTRGDHVWRQYLSTPSQPNANLFSACIDTKRNLMVISNSNGYFPDPNNPGGAWIQSRDRIGIIDMGASPPTYRDQQIFGSLVTSGAYANGPSVFSEDGLCYDPINDRYLMMSAWSFGVSRCMAIDPVTFNVTQVGVALPPAQGGVNNRWEFIPSLQGCIFCVAWASPLYFLPCS